MSKTGEMEKRHSTAPLEETIGLLPVPGNVGFENIPIRDDMTKDEILAYNRLKLKSFVNEQRAEAAKAAREQVLKLVWIEVQSCGVSKEVFEGISRNVIAKSVRTQQEPQQEGRR
jgi:hypothetical protein